MRARLVTIDPDTAVVTVVGLFNAGNSGGNPATMADLAFTTNGALYGIGTSGGPHLYSIDLGTGKATFAGSSGMTSTAGGGLAVSSAGVFYGTPTGDRFGTYNPTNGAFLNIDEPFRPVGNAYGALEFNKNGVLYGMNASGGNPSLSRLVTFNVATAEITDLGASANSLDAIAFRIVPPALSIVQASNQVTLRWPDSSGFTLQYKTNLTSGAWLTNTATVTLNTGTNSVTLPIEGTAKFFRLRKP